MTYQLAEAYPLDDYLVSIRPGAFFGHDPPDFVRAFLQIIIDHVIVELGCGRHFLRCRLLPYLDLLRGVSGALADAPSQFGFGRYRDEYGGGAGDQSLDRAGALDVGAEKDVPPACERLPDRPARDAFVLTVNDCVFQQFTIVAKALEFHLRHEMVVDAFLLAGTRRACCDVSDDIRRRILGFKSGQEGVLSRS